MTRRLEQGNVVGFVLIGMVLTAALVGGVWLARQPSSDTSSQTASDTTTSQQADEDTSTNTATTDEELKETLSQQATQSSTDKESTSTTESSTTTSTSTTSNLPVTGPADTLLEMLGATLLAGVTVAYIRSRSIA